MNKLLKLRYLLFVPLLCLLLLSGKLSGAEQQERMTISLKDVPITQFFKEFEKRCS
jgi:hypothetical protein